VGKLSFGGDDRPDGKFARNLQLGIIGFIAICLVVSRLATGIVTNENALFFIIIDGIIMMILVWYANYVWRNF